MLTKMPPYSFVDQDFIWVADYFDGTSLCEYNPTTKQREDFYSIRKDKLTRFGLVGHGMKLYYEVGGGFFKLQGQLYEIVYEENGKEYYLTGQIKPYNDVITYKDAEAWMSKGGQFPSKITAFNFGYKQALVVDGVNFLVKAIVSIPFNSPVTMTIRLVGDRKMDGKLVIKKNGTKIAEIGAPLNKGVGGEFKWTVK